MLVTVSNFEYIFKYCCPIKFNILSLSIVGMFHLWLFLQQRCKIFVAICLPQKSKPQRSLMQLFVSIFTNYKCFGISCRTTK
jgi:esterase/lipase